MGEISDKVIDKNIKVMYSETFTNSAEFGVISQRDFFDKDISNSDNLSNYYVVQNNDFIYNPRISNFAPVGPIRRNKLGRTGVMSPLYYVFRVRNVQYEFLDAFFETDKWHSFMKLYGDMGARSDRISIKDSIFAGMPLMLPSLEEQTAIGNFFKQLDDTIALHRRNCIKFQNLKTAYLENIFSAKYIQNKDKNKNAWEQRKLGELVEFFSGLTYSPQDITDETGVLVLRSSNVQDNRISSADNVYVAHKVVNVKNVQVGDIIVVVRNGSRNLIGKHALINNEMKNTVIGAFMTGIRSSNSLFINALLNTPKFISEIEKNLGATINQITIGAFKLMEFKVPTQEEQTAIGNFFKQLDDTIALHQRFWMNNNQLGREYAELF
ncbi:type I restriction-modification system subunit S [[Actinobacillus] rossii]|uniref:Type I restriction-modification system subunit S n=1 Tax=[Actinobacillus] rossii TaxID=123820 RepID=A0A380U319_9PAST|nr:type I restriction-modification system subunit S [[Actinobacillus] rossii]